MELVSKKVPKSIIPKLRRLQARYMFSRQKRVSEAEIIEKAIDMLAEKEDAIGNKHKYTLLDLVGFIKCKKGPTTEKDIDEVVYGDVNRT